MTQDAAWPHQKDQPDDLKIDAWSHVISDQPQGVERTEDEFNHVINDSITHTYVMKFYHSYLCNEIPIKSLDTMLGKSSLIGNTLGIILYVNMLEM